MGNTDYAVQTQEAVIVYRVHHYISTSRVAVLYTCQHIDDALAAYPHARQKSETEFFMLRRDIKARAALQGGR